MTYACDDFETLPRMPAWVARGRPEAAEDVAFLSGASLSHLDLVLRFEQVPQALVRERLALRAAEARVAQSGRPERAGELRDAVAFLQPGDSAGPAGEVFLSWRMAVERPNSTEGLSRALPGFDAEQVAGWLDVGQGGPVARAAAVFEAASGDRRRDLTTALILAEAALARELGWGHVVPLLALGLKRSDLRKTGDDLCDAFHLAILTAAAEVTREAMDLTRRAARLKAVAPKLRAKGAEEAVDMFFSREGVAPATLISLRSGRSARRFCDRLVELGAVRELTGRDTFRLYGL